MGAGPGAVQDESIGGGATSDEQVNQPRKLQRRSQLGGGRRRDREMRFRVSDQEYTEIRAAAQRAGAAYGTFIVHTVQAAARQHKFGHQPTAGICEELRSIARQLNRIGVNLNQLARIANATGQVPDELPAALSYLENVLRRVDASSVEIGRLLR
ncbi:MobC family plasmid mobilization relaxosome protein [Actinomadura geliboluensis]|uniref:MobC family plasmid mobilization relaxosome protein n=1 Tax=Actinomadura geliboluensis TaxID=882440 RepID=UPI0037192FFC